MPYAPCSSPVPSSQRSCGVARWQSTIVATSPLRNTSKRQSPGQSGMFRRGSARASNEAASYRRRGCRLPASLTADLYEPAQNDAGLDRFVPDSVSYANSPPTGAPQMRFAPTLFAVTLGALPLQAAKADCSFPLALPFCIAGAVVNAATRVATAPFYGSYAPSYGVASSYYYRGSYYRRTHYYHHALNHHTRYYNHRVTYHRSIAEMRPITRTPEPAAAPTSSTVDDAAVEPPPQRR